MFYEEKVLNGVLHYRNISGGAWIEVTKEELTEKYLREKDNNGGYAQLPEVLHDIGVWGIENNIAITKIDKLKNIIVGHFG